MTETAIILEGNKLNPDAYLELFIFDTTTLNPANQNLYFTNTSIQGLDKLLWKGDEYLYLPFKFSGIVHKGDATALAQPTISISNISRLLMSTILSLGDLTGSNIIRQRTFYKFTDNGSEANPLATFPEEHYIVIQKKSQSRLSIEYLLSTALDIPSAKLPARQILRDGDGSPGSEFPGAGRVRRR